MTECRVRRRSLLSCPPRFMGSKHSLHSLWRSTPRRITFSSKLRWPRPSLRRPPSGLSRAKGRSRIEATSCFWRERPDRGPKKGRKSQQAKKKGRNFHRRPRQQVKRPKVGDSNNHTTLFYSYKKPTLQEFELPLPQRPKPLRVLRHAAAPIPI